MIGETRNDPRARDVLNHPLKESVNNAVRAHGVKCEIRKGTICPCLNEDTLQPRMNCAICHGVGYYYDSALVNSECPVGSTIHKVAMGQRNYTKHRDKTGGYRQSGAHVAIIYTYVPSDGDLITPFEDTEVINDEVHVRGSLFNDGSSSERLHHEQVLSTEYIIKANANRTAIVKYLQGTNYNVTGNLIEWVVGQPQPLDGEQYVVRYKARPSYIIFNVQPTMIVEHDEAYPKFIREEIDVVYPYQVQLERLDRRILGNQKQYGF